MCSKLKNGGQDAKYIPEILVKSLTQKAECWPSPQTHTDGSKVDNYSTQPLRKPIKDEQSITAPTSQQQSNYMGTERDPGAKFILVVPQGPSSFFPCHARKSSSVVGVTITSLLPSIQGGAQPTF